MFTSINEWKKQTLMKPINEGQFSWFTQDTNSQIGNERENQIPVYMFDNKGNKWFEPAYEGYGVFGGKDFFELMAEMNGITEGDLDTKRNKAIYELQDKADTLKPALVQDANFNWQNHDFTDRPQDDPNQGWLVDDEDDEPEDWWEDEEDEDDDMYEASTTSKPDDKILNKITKAICKTITSKMGGKITKEMDLKDMVLDYMGANGYGEDKKVASQVVKMVKAEFKAKHLNENKIGYTAGPDSKIYITPEAEQVFKAMQTADGRVYGHEPFVAKHGICRVKLYTYRNRPNKFVYISIDAKTQGYDGIMIEQLVEATMLTEDLNECIAFINGLEKA